MCLFTLAGVMFYEIMFGIINSEIALIETVLNITTIILHELRMNSVSFRSRL